jgi:hypothetical protein
VRLPTTQDPGLPTQRPNGGPPTVLIVLPFALSNSPNSTPRPPLPQAHLSTTTSASSTPTRPPPPPTIIVCPLLHFATQSYRSWPVFPFLPDLGLLNTVPRSWATLPLTRHNHHQHLDFTAHPLFAPSKSKKLLVPPRFFSRPLLCPRFFSTRVPEAWLPIGGLVTDLYNVTVCHRVAFRFVPPSRRSFSRTRPLRSSSP